MKRLSGAVIAVAALLLVFASPCLAGGPVIRDLTSPTHPDPESWCADNDPVFSWGAALVPVGQCDTPGHAFGVAVSGSHAYVADGVGGLHVVDITEPTAPAIIGSCDTPGYAQGVAVVGDYAYVADDDDLLVIDVRDPAVPVVVGSCAFSGNASGVAVAGGYAYVADGYGGLRIVDIGDPAAPSLVGTYESWGGPTAVAVAGVYAYLAAEHEGMEVVDVSDPASPELRGSQGVGGSARGIAVQGDYAYMTDLYGGLSVVDITDPALPEMVGHCSTPFITYRVCVADGRAYVAAAENGLHAIGVGDPTAPVLEGVCETPGDAHDVAVAGGHAYVADGDSGLQVASTDVTTTFAYSYSLDQSPATEPDTIAEGGATTAAYADVADGTSYFHVRAIDTEGTWGPTAHFRVNIDTTGPTTLAFAAKTAKRGTVLLEYLVEDTVSDECSVTIELQSARGRAIHTMELGWQPGGRTLTTAIDVPLRFGRYWFVVHATDELGNPEECAGRAKLVVR